MHILFLPSFYPDRTRPTNGLFFKKFAQAVISEFDKVGVLYVEQRSLRSFTKLNFQEIFKLTRHNDNGIIYYSFSNFNLFNQYSIGCKIWVFISFKLFKKYIKDNGKPDLIHVHNVFNSGLLALKIKKEFGINYVVTEHSSGFLLNEFSKNKLADSNVIFTNASKVSAVSNRLSEAIGAFSKNLEISLLPNIVDTDHFIIDQSNTKYEVFTFISVGNLLRNKGHHVLIEAFKKFHDVHSNSQLLIFGIGKEFINLTNLIRKLKLTNSVFLRGFIHPAQLADEYNKCHCFVLPSFKETFGVVIIEAMACGLPVIATRSGGPEDLIYDFNGYLVPPGEINDMYEAMLNAFREINKFDSFFISEFITRNYSKPIVKNKLLEFYRLLC